MRRMLALCGLLIAAWSAEPIVQQAHAQESSASSERTKSARSKRAKRAKKNKRSAAAPEPAAAVEPATPAPAPNEPKTEAKVPAVEGAAPAPESKASASSAISTDEGQIRKEGDTEVKTLEFTGLDIEGQLKTPQLLYFLTRLRAEFDRPRLPHRSFMPELQRTPGEKSLR